MEKSLGNMLIEVSNLWRTYKRGSEIINACAGINLTVKAGEMLAIVGRSGSGKTTLLNQIGCLDVPTSGEIKISGIDVTRMKESMLVGFRRQRIGFIFQLFYLIPTLTVWENVELPLIFSRKRSRDKVSDNLKKTGIYELKDMLPGQLDGGSMQKVAIARALVNNPEILLADEPTGRLEAKSKDEIFSILKNLCKQGLTLIIATHDPSLAARTERIIYLSDGKVIKEEIPAKEKK